MEESIFYQPENLGPGVWFTIHIMAINATSYTLKEAFIEYINKICDGFRCQKCQFHFRKFIDSNPLRGKYWDMKDGNGREIGFFYWTWEIHDQVNIFLKKHRPSFEQCYKFYKGESSTPAATPICTTCGPVGSSSGHSKYLPETPSKRNRHKPKPILTVVPISSKKSWKGHHWRT